MLTACTDVGHLQETWNAESVNATVACIRARHNAFVPRVCESDQPRKRGTQLQTKQGTAWSASNLSCYPGGVQPDLILSCTYVRRHGQWQERSLYYQGSDQQGGMTDNGDNNLPCSTNSCMDLLRNCVLSLFCCLQWQCEASRASTGKLAERIAAFRGCGADRSSAIVTNWYKVHEVAVRLTVSLVAPVDPRR
jgi:hypothetical protein